MIQEINMGCVQCGVGGVGWVRDLVCVMEAEGVGTVHGVNAVMYI